MPQVEGEIQSRLTIRTEESAVLRGVLEGPHVHMESSLYDRHRALHLHIHGIVRTADDLEAVSLRKANHSIVAFLRGAKPGSELLRSEELAVGGAGGFVEILQ